MLRRVRPPFGDFWLIVSAQAHGAIFVLRFHLDGRGGVDERLHVAGVAAHDERGLRDPGARWAPCSPIVVRRRRLSLRSRATPVAGGPLRWNDRCEGIAGEGRRRRGTGRWCRHRRVTGCYSDRVWCSNRCWCRCGWYRGLWRGCGHGHGGAAIAASRTVSVPPAMTSRAARSIRRFGPRAAAGAAGAGVAGTQAAGSTTAVLTPVYRVDNGCHGDRCHSGNRRDATTSSFWCTTSAVVTLRHWLHAVSDSGISRSHRAHRFIHTTPRGTERALWKGQGSYQGSRPKCVRVRLSKWRTYSCGVFLTDLCACLVSRLWCQAVNR